MYICKIELPDNMVEKFCEVFREIVKQLQTSYRE